MRLRSPYRHCGNTQTRSIPKGLLALQFVLAHFTTGEKIGVSEGTIRHYETNFRTPKQPQVEAIAEALDISPLALKDFRVENARDLLGLLLQLEDEFGIVPAENESGLSIDVSAEKAPKTTQMLKAWAAKRNELESGRITPEEYADWKAKF